MGNDASLALIGVLNALLLGLVGYVAVLVVGLRTKVDDVAVKQATMSGHWVEAQRRVESHYEEDRDQFREVWKAFDDMRRRHPSGRDT